MFYPLLDLTIILHADMNVSLFKVLLHTQLYIFVSQWHVPYKEIMVVDCTLQFSILTLATKPSQIDFFV